jgi:Cft2 family RNA processing exonuclease
MNLKYPIYFSTGLTEKANHYYKLFISWTNQKIKNTFVQRNMFDFKHIRAFDRSYIDQPGPMVLYYHWSYHHSYRLSLQHLVCFMQAYLYKYLRNGQKMKRTCW